MMRQLKQRKRKNRLYSWWAIIILVIVAFFFVNNTWDVYKKYSASKNNIFGLDDRYQVSQDREKELREKIEYLHSERGLEGEIREKFNVAKEGEQVIVIIYPEVEEKNQETEEEGFVRSLWGRVLGVFR